MNNTFSRKKLTDSYDFNGKLKYPNRNMRLGFLLCSVMFLLASQIHAFPASTNRCLNCHGNQKPAQNGSVQKLAPLLSEFFSMDWEMFTLTTQQSPPFLEIPKPYSVSRGKTFYDWPEKKMTEIYFDRCIDIFPSGNEFSCQFLSDHDKTYFITFALNNLDEPQSCCLWSEEEFWAPRPDVLQNMSFQKESEYQKQKINWWSYDIPLPGPFGYGMLSENIPYAFWFPVISGWVQQNFSNYLTAKPDPSVFQIPVICRREMKFCSANNAPSPRLAR